MALLACRLETGRTHQIRVHLAAIGHPVIGDAAYGTAEATLAGAPSSTPAGWPSPTPAPGSRGHFDAPLPDDLRRLPRPRPGGAGPRGRASPPVPATSKGRGEEFDVAGGRLSGTDTGGTGVMSSVTVRRGVSTQPEMVVRIR